MWLHGLRVSWESWPGGVPCSWAEQPPKCPFWLRDLPSPFLSLWDFFAGLPAPVNTSSHSNRTYKGLWALTGVSACLCLSDNPGLLPLTLSSPRLLVPSWQRSSLPGAGGKKELNKGNGQTSFQKWPPDHPSTHPSPRGQECAHWG